MQNENSLITSYHGSSSDSLKVCDLILDDYSGWNETLIHHTFDQVEATKIKVIPFSQSRPDVLAKKHEKNRNLLHEIRLCGIYEKIEQGIHYAYKQAKPKMTVGLEA